MKINISYNQTRYTIQVAPTDNVFKLKQKINTAIVRASNPAATTLESLDNSQTVSPIVFIER